MNLDKIYEEVYGYLDSLNVDEDGEHLWTNYETITAILIRLTQIRTDLAYLELTGEASPQHKKFRTAILEDVINRFEKVAMYESRKITARHIEYDMERK